MTINFALSHTENTCTRLWVNSLFAQLYTRFDIIKYFCKFGGEFGELTRLIVILKINKTKLGILLNSDYFRLERDDEEREVREDDDEGERE